MSFKMTLPWAQEVLREAHGKVAQIQHDLVYQMQEGKSPPQECFCVVGFLLWKSGETEILHYPETSAGDMVRKGEPREHGYVLGMSSEIAEVLDVPPIVISTLFDWNDEAGYSFQTIADRLPRLWNAEQGDWLEVIRS